MVNIANQLVMMADSTSETWYELVDDASGGREVIYRSGIHAFLVEMSHMCNFWVFEAPYPGRASLSNPLTSPRVRHIRPPLPPFGWAHG